MNFQKWELFSGSPGIYQQYLHKKSCHAWHTKKAIPYGQTLRFRRICSEDRQFQERVGELAGWLKEKGYVESLINEQIHRFRRLDRTALLANAGSRINNQGRGAKGSTCCDIPSSTQ